MSKVSAMKKRVVKVRVSGFRVQGSGFRVQGSGFKSVACDRFSLKALLAPY